MHGIAHQKQAAAAIIRGRRPLAGQAPQQAVLTERDVLIFVHQQMPDLIIQAQGQVGRRVLVAQRAERRLGDADKIHAVFRGKDQAQLGGGQFEQITEGLDDAPFGLAVVRVGQLLKGRERLPEARRLLQFQAQCLHEFLMPAALDCLRLIAAGRREALPLVPSLAPLAVFGQQQLADAAPLCQPPGAGRRQTVQGVTMPDRTVGRVFGQMPGRIPREGRQRDGLFRREKPADLGQLRLDQGRQRLFHRRPVMGRDHISQPLIAFCQHVHKQRPDARQIVVEMGDEARHGRRPGRALLQRGQGIMGGLLIQAGGVFHGLRLRAEARQQRHLPGQGGRERINGLDAEPGRVIHDLPALLFGAPQRGPSQGKDFCVMPAGGPGRSGRPFQRREDAPLHLGGGLAGKGDRDDLLGRVSQR